MNFIEYVKQLWKNGPGGGTPWSAARLNHMEDGIKNNNSMISELNNNLTIKTYNIRDNVPMYAYGKTCLIHIDIRLDLKVGWNELGTLPSNFSPLTQFEQIMLNGARKPQGWARVSVDNQVLIYSDVEYSGYIVGEIIYLAK
ncbi:MAG: hypothetical protein ACLVCM_04845 [Lachnospira sp.]